MLLHAATCQSEKQIDMSIYKTINVRDKLNFVKNSAELDLIDLNNLSLVQTEYDRTLILLKTIIEQQGFNWAEYKHINRIDCNYI